MVGVHCKSPLPALPRELWLHIFQQVSWIPGGLEQEHVEPTAPRPYFSARERLRALTTALKSTSRVVRVCKLWNTLASPYLYRCITLRHGRGLFSLVATITSSRFDVERNAGIRSLGSWTERLIVALKTTIDGPTHADECRLLADLVRSLPNLVFITFHTTDKRRFMMPREVAVALATTCGPSLRVLGWTPPSVSSSPPLHDFEHLVSVCPRLRCLWAVFWSHPFNLPALPQLTTLTLRGDLPGPISTMGLTNKCTHPFPSLREIHYNAAVYDSYITLLRFLELHGHGITAIVLDFINGGRDPPISDMKYFCPKLVRLDIYVHSWHQLGISSLPVPIVGLRCEKVQSSRSEYMALLDTLTATETPLLRRVQLLDRRTATDLRIRHPGTLGEFVHVLASRGVRFEDQDGVFLGDIDAGET
jgi:hypothetical protein